MTCTDYIRKIANYVLVVVNIVTGLRIKQKNNPFLVGFHRELCTRKTRINLKWITIMTIA